MQLILNQPIVISDKGSNELKRDVVYPLAESLLATNRLFIIADAIGPWGGKAAEICCTGFRTYFEEVNPPGDTVVSQLYVNEALRYVERKVQDYIRKTPAQRNMGCSVIMAYVNTNYTISLAWVGNARAYHFRGKKIVQKTEDHLMNVSEFGKIKTVARAIDGKDPSWASVVNISTIETNDYLLLCTQGVLQTFNDRNLKYLFSQANGEEEVSQQIAEKIHDLCSTNSSSDFSAFIIPIRQGNVATQTAENTNTLAANASTKKIAAKSPVIGFGSRDVSGKNRRALVTPVQTLAFISIILLMVGSAFAFKYFSNRPEDIYAQKVSKANNLFNNYQYVAAIEAYNKALSVNLEDTSDFPLIRKKIQEASILNLIQMADSYAKGDNWVKAEAKYRLALQLAPNNLQLKRKIDVLIRTMDTRKRALINVADSLIAAKDYDSAKASLFEALYLDQQDSSILRLINQCNTYLDTDSISFTDAVFMAELMDSTKRAFVEEQTVDNSTPTDTISTDSLADNTQIYTPIRNSQAQEAIKKQERINEQYNELLATANAAMNKKDWATAKTNYEQAYQMKRSDELARKINQCEKEIISNKYQALKQEGDAAFANGNYTGALIAYQQMLSYKQGDEYAVQQIDLCKDNIAATSKQKSKYDNFISLAAKAYKEGSYATAKKQYQSALGVSTHDEAFVKEQIAKCNTKMNNMAAVASTKKVRKAERICRTNNYNEACYDYLKTNQLMYSVDKQVLFKLSQFFEQKDANKARECYNIASE